MEGGLKFEEEYLACCGSTKFAKEMIMASASFSSLGDAVAAARDIWFNKVDVTGWLQAFAAHPQIGNTPSSSTHATFAQWSKGEQSIALATATGSSLQKLAQWNSKYREKFGFVFVICASGKSTDAILAEFKAVKDKIGEMSAMKKVKEEARAEERAEKEIAKARAEVAHEVRLAKEAEATMVHHVAKAGEIAREGERLAHEQMAKLGGTDDASSGTGAGAPPNNAASNPLPTTNMSPPTYNKMS